MIEFLKDVRFCLKIMEQTMRSSLHDKTHCQYCGAHFNFPDFKYESHSHNDGCVVETANTLLEKYKSL